MGYSPAYTDNLTPARKGAIANTEPNILISRQVEGAAIPYGVAVKQGTADNGIAAATAAADKFRGITVQDQSSLDSDDYNVGEDAIVLTMGVVWVTAGATVAAGDPVYMIVGTGNAGKFTNSPTSNLLIPDAVFDSSGVLDGLAKIRLR